jgi:hypothetical protein
LLDRDDELVTFSLLDKPMDLGAAARRTLGETRTSGDVSGMQDQDTSGESCRADKNVGLRLSLLHLAAMHGLLWWVAVPAPVRLADTGRLLLLLLLLLLWGACVLQTQTLTMVAWRRRLQRWPGSGQTP